jgi:predicted alpha/beta superfamily hydrolase
MSHYAQIPQVSSGKITRHENFESRFVTPRNVDVWLPADYDASRTYAVLYMHDGQMLFDSAFNWNHQEWGVDEVMAQLLKEKKVRDCIVVGIWNTQFRHPEYFPQKAINYLTETEKTELLNYSVNLENTKLLSDGPIADNYLKFIVTELKPFIDKTYSTKSDRQNTSIAGSSMGGLISMYAICEYPDVFGGSACLSTHWPGTFQAENNPVPTAFLHYLKDHLPPPGTHRFYFDYGSETIDALYKPFQLQADTIMMRAGYTEANWVTLEFQGENHSEIAWNKRLHIPLEFLLK